MPLFFQFNQFLDSRAEIRQNLRWFFGNFKTSKSHNEINWPLDPPIQSFSDVIHGWFLRQHSNENTWFLPAVEVGAVVVEVAVSEKSLFGWGWISVLPVLERHLLSSIARLLLFSPCDRIFLQKWLTHCNEI